MFEIDAIRKKIEFEIIEGPGIPEIVYGDSSKIRQVSPSRFLGLRIDLKLQFYLGYCQPLL